MKGKVGYGNNFNCSQLIGASKIMNHEIVQRIIEMGFDKMIGEVWKSNLIIIGTSKT